MTTSLRNHISIRISLSTKAATSLANEPGGRIAREVQTGLRKALRELRWIDRLERACQVSGVTC
jgi:hypothetical protein